MFKTILVPLDGSPLGEKALPVAATLAKAAQAHLVLMQAAGLHLDEARLYLEHLARHWQADGLPVEVTVAWEPAAEAIVSQIRSQPADLVVMSTHGRSGLSRMVFGSVAEAVVTHSPAPVLLVRATKDMPRLAGAPHPTILVPLDGSEFAETALPYASVLARHLDATLILLHIVPEPIDFSIFNANTQQLLDDIEKIYQRQRRYAQRHLDQVAAHLVKTEVRVQTCVGRGAASHEILAYCDKQGVDLVVMATHGRTGVGRVVMGSVALSVLEHGHLPALLVRPTATVQASAPPVATLAG